VPLAVPLFASGEMYKCVDERGVTSYSDKPRPGCKGGKVDIQGSPPITGRVQEPQRDGAQDDAAFKRRQIERERAENTEMRARDALQQRCANLRSELGRLNNGRRLAETTPSGERVYMDDQTREQKIAQANADLRGCP
jgi:hypothetical protein